MKRIYVKPREGVVCPLEDGTYVPKGGKEVNETSFVRRRIKEGSLIVVLPEKKKGGKK